MKKMNKLLGFILWILPVIAIIALIIVAEYFAIKALLVTCLILFFLWLLAVMITTTIAGNKGLSKKRVIISYVLTGVMIIIAGLSIGFQFYAWQNNQQYSAQISDLRIQRDKTDDADEKQAIYLQIDELEKEMFKGDNVQFASNMAFLTNFVLFSTLRIVNETARKKSSETI